MVHLEVSTLWRKHLPHELGQRTIAHLIIRLCINTDKQIDHPSRRAIAIVRLESSWITSQDGWSIAVYKCKKKMNHPWKLHRITRIQLLFSVNYKHSINTGRVTQHIDSSSHNPSSIYTRWMILLDGWSVSSINQANHWWKMALEELLNF